MTDRNVFRAVVLFLGGTLALTVLGIAVLAGIDKAIPGILENVAVGCLTGLAGLLARGPSDEPQQVVVTNRPDEAVPVEDAGHVDALFLLGIAFAVCCGILLAGVISRAI